MIRAYLLIAMRSFVRRPGHGLVNMLGLSVGIAVAAITTLYLRHELRYDAFHTHADHIFRISGKQNDSWFAALSAPYSNYITENQISEIDTYARIRRWPPKYISHNENTFYERKVFFTDVDSKFFELFDFKPIEGNPQSAFRKPNSVVLTRSMALTLFGDGEAVGQALSFDTLALTVTAVVEDPPSNSNFDFKVLIANQTAMEHASALFTYCKINENADVKSVLQKVLAFRIPSEEFSKLQDVRMIPLKDLHFEGNMVYEMKPAGNKSYMVVFLTIGGAILVLTVFNFINLSVAVYSQRTKEIAVRKIVGAKKRQIAKQFLLESIVTTVACLPLVLILIQLVIPFFNSYMDVKMPNEFIQTPNGIFVIVVGMLMVGMMAGSYPAWLLSRVSSVFAFKGKNNAFGSWNLRTVLVSLQITAMVLIFAVSWMVHLQLQFINDKDLGFEKEGVIKLKGAWTVDSLSYARIKSRMLENPAVVSVSNGFAPGDEDYGMTFRSEESDELHTDLITFGTDEHYVETLGLKIISLRDGASLSVGNLVLVNETMAKRLAFDDAMGQCVIVSPGKKHERRKVIDGVFADFHFFSLHQRVSPMMLTIRPFGSGINENILVKVKRSNISETYDHINKIAREESPTVPLVAEFLDDTLAGLYMKEQQLLFFSRILLVITVLIAALGLVGLASYMVHTRTKEIGVRKVLGATIADVVLLVGRPFFRLTVVAFLLGSGVSFVLLDRWLESFAYRIPMLWLVFACTLGGVFVLLSVTVGTHALRAAQSDPVKAIRSE